MTQARIDFDPLTGIPRRYTQDDALEGISGYEPLAGTVAARFDPSTNAALIAAFGAGTLRRLADGTLTVGGVPQAILPDSPEEADRKALRAAQLVTALLAGTATNAQAQGALGRLIRSLMRQGVIG